MKKILIAFVGIFCIASLIVLGQITQGKPDKSGAQWIEFYGVDLEGGEWVEGCCPNAGPWPDYTMTLNFGSYNFSPGTYYGKLFINYFGAGRNQKYKVQFWWNYEEDLGIEIIGGVLDFDRKNRILTVTFTDEECVHIKTGTPIKLVNFTLVRSPY